MEPQPGSERLRKTVGHEEPDRLPLWEGVVDYSIMSKFTGKTVNADTLDTQVEFWAHAGYDFIPLTVGLLPPGKVTQESAIMQIIRDHVFPWYKEIARRCHENGLLYFQHTDGNILPLLEDLIDIGIDALHPIDPTCLDIVKMKQDY